MTLPTVDPLVALAGLVVGLIVGMTGMGGGALMTPILVLVFRVHPLAAVSSDLVASAFMKPAGVVVHASRGTVDRRLVLWLALGSIPAAFAGVFVLRALGPAPELNTRLRYLLGVVLLVATFAVLARAVLIARRRARGTADVDAVSVRPLSTVAIGALAGLIVGMTSVGSGSLVIVMLMLLYPGLRTSRLVGTDLAQALPLVAAAALGHLLLGDFKLNLTLAIVVGGIPGVYLGSRLSAKAPDAVIRPVIAFVLLASGLSLLQLPTLLTGVLLVLAVTVGLPLWGAMDATSWNPGEWGRTRHSRSRWIAAQIGGACLPVVGAVVAIAYFASVRPSLSGARDSIA